MHPSLAVGAGRGRSRVRRSSAQSEVEQTISVARAHLVVEAALAMPVCTCAARRGTQLGGGGRVGGAVHEEHLQHYGLLHLAITHWYLCEAGVGHNTYLRRNKSGSEEGNTDGSADGSADGNAEGNTDGSAAGFSPALEHPSPGSVLAHPATQCPPPIYRPCPGPRLRPRGSCQTSSAQTPW